MVLGKRKREEDDTKRAKKQGKSIEERKQEIITAILSLLGELKKATTPEERERIMNLIKAQLISALEEGISVGGGLEDEIRAAASETISVDGMPLASIEELSEVKTMFDIIKELEETQEQIKQIKVVLDNLSNQWENLLAKFVSVMKDADEEFTSKGFISEPVAQLIVANMQKQIEHFNERQAAIDLLDQAFNQQRKLFKDIKGLHEREAPQHPERIQGHPEKIQSQSQDRPEIIKEFYKAHELEIKGPLLFGAIISENENAHFTAGKALESAKADVMQKISDIINEKRMTFNPELLSAFYLAVAPTNRNMHSQPRATGRAL